MCNVFHAFAASSFADELAHLAGRDSLEFLLELSTSLIALQEQIEQRRTERVARIDAATGAAKQALQDDDALDARVADQLGSLAQQTIDHIHQMAGPKGQFSALVQAWIRAYLA